MPNVTGSKLQHYSDRICFLNAIWVTIINTWRLSFHILIQTIIL